MENEIKTTENNLPTEEQVVNTIIENVFIRGIELDAYKRNFMGSGVYEALKKLFIGDNPTKLTKPRIINVIETIENDVRIVESFVITDANASHEAEKVQAAENLLVQKAKENGFGEGEDQRWPEEIVEDTYYENGNYKVAIVWSEVQN